MPIIGLVDLDIYLLNFLDLKSILNLSLISKKQKLFMLGIPLFNDINDLIKKESWKNLSENIVNISSKHARISILDWLKNSGFEFNYTMYAINRASVNGHTNVLEWFKKNGFG